MRRLFCLPGLLMALTGCASDVGPSAGPLVPLDAHLLEPSAELATVGRSGIVDVRSAEGELRWLTARATTFTVRNLRSTTEVVRVRGTLVPPPCRSTARLTVTFAGPPRVIDIGLAGVPLTVSAIVGRGGTARLLVEADTAACQLPQGQADRRQFYAGLVGATAGGSAG